MMCLLASCGGPPSAPEQEIREWVGVAQQAAESRARRQLMSLVSPGYTDARGYERDDIENLLRVYFLRQNNIQLLTSIDEIRLFGDTAAEVEITVGMAGTNDGVLGFSADAYQFFMELEKTNGDWQLIAARWGELGGELH